MALMMWIWGVNVVVMMWSRRFWWCESEIVVDAVDALTMLWMLWQCCGCFDNAVDALTMPWMPDDAVDIHWINKQTNKQTNNHTCASHQMTKTKMRAMETARTMAKRKTKSAHPSPGWALRKEGQQQHATILPRHDVFLLRFLLRVLNRDGDLASSPPPGMA